MKNRLIHITILLFLAATLPSAADAISCPLKSGKPYKTKTSATVYYITIKCTKRPFKNEKTFFSYFKSWKEVKIVSNTTLKKITADKLGPMTAKKKPKKKTPTPPIKPSETGKPAPTSTTTTPVMATNPPLSDSAPIPTPPETKTVASGVIEKFLTCPSEAEIAELNHDFDLRFADNDMYRWSDYPYLCDYNSTNPSRLMTYATLRFLKQLEFTKPLPFTGGVSLYDYMRLQTVTDKLDNPKLIINPLLECTTYSTGGWSAKIINGVASYTLEVNMSGVFSRVYPVVSGSSDCASALPAGSFTSSGLVNNFIYHPIYRAGLFVHEAQHAVARKPHTGLNGGDATIEEMGAWATQFYFNAWIALYSTNTDPPTQQLAKSAAANILATRFSQNKCPSDPELKSIINTIKNNTCL